MIRVALMALLLLLVACQSGSNYIDNWQKIKEIKVDNPKRIQNKELAKNIMNEPLQTCCNAPQTGFFRDGFCHFDDNDYGVHLICAVMTDEYLAYSKSQGNDLITANPERHFPGLKKGDKWCLCVSRWEEAYKVGLAPRIDIQATHAKVSQMIPIEVLIENGN